MKIALIGSSGQLGTDFRKVIPTDYLTDLNYPDFDITNRHAIQKLITHKNFEIVKQKLIEIEEHDKLRNWQPPISGEIIIDTFNIRPSKEVGDIKNHIREAILDGKLENDFNSAYQFMLKIGNEMGLIAKKEK